MSLLPLERSSPWILPLTCPSDPPLLVEDVTYIPGHVALVAQNRQILWVWDAAPQSKRPTDQQLRKLNSAIVRQELQPTGMPVMLVSYVSADKCWRSVHFDAGPPLRLIALQDNGSLTICTWSVNEYQWRLSSRNSELSPMFSSSRPPTLLSSTYCPTYRMLIWCESIETSRPLDADGVASSPYSGEIRPATSVEPRRKLQVWGRAIFPTGEGEGRAISRESPPILIRTFDADGEEPVQLCAARDGVWIITPTTLAYWSLRKEHLCTVPLSPQFDAAALAYSRDSIAVAANTFRLPLLGHCTHPFTHELLLLDSAGRIFLAVPPVDGDHPAMPHTTTLSPYSHSSSGIRLVLLVTLPQWEDDIQSDLSHAANSTQVTLLAYHGMVGIATRSCYHVYDLKCGRKMGKLPLPANLQGTPRTWRLGLHGSPVGLWAGRDDGGLWLAQPAPIKPSDQSEFLPRGAPSSDTPHGPQCGALHSRLSGHTRWYAKYLLDVATSAQSREDDKETAVRGLLPHLQSPALAVAALSPLAHRQLLRDEVATFLSKSAARAYAGDTGEDDTAANEREEADKVANRTAFHYYTTLNKALKPLLAKYAQLTSVQPLTALSETPHAEGASAEGLLDGTRGTLESMVREDPRGTLTLLVRALQLDMSLFAPLPPVPPALPPVAAAALLHPEESPADAVTISAAGPSTTAAGSSSSSSSSASPSASSSSSSSLSSSSAATSTASSAVYSARHSLFETLCRLLYTQCPESLPGFVAAVSAAAKKAATNGPAKGSAAANRSAAASASKRPRAFVMRALHSLPPPVAGSSPAQIEAYAALCLQLAQPTRALAVYLEGNQWESALALVRRRSDQDIEHFELFHQLLRYCLIARDCTKLSQAWELMPNNLGVFELFALLRSALDESAQSESELSPSTLDVLVPEEDSESREGLCVGAFRMQLLHMFGKMKRNENSGPGSGTATPTASSSSLSALLAAGSPSPASASAMPAAAAAPSSIYR